MSQLEQTVQTGKPIRAVIWDLGGVLLRTEDYTPRQQLAERLGITRAELEELVFGGLSGKRAQMGEIEVDQHWENVRLALQLAADEMTAFQTAFWSGDRLDRNLVDKIHSLRPSLQTALLSNAFSDLRQVLTDEFGIANAFDSLVISAEVKLMKPDPRIYLLVCEQLAIAPEQAVFIDDFQRNVTGAQAVGMAAIHFQNPAQAWQELIAMLPAQDPG